MNETHTVPGIPRASSPSVALFASPSPSHVALPSRLNMRPMVRESVLRARFASLFRLLSLRPRHGRHGVAYLRGM